MSRLEVLLGMQEEILLWDSMHTPPSDHAEIFAQRGNAPSQRYTMQ